METGGRFGWKVLVMVALLTAGMGGVLDAEATDCALAITDWEKYCCVEKVDEWSGTVKCTLTGDARQENIDEELETVWDVGDPFTNEAESESGNETELYLDLGLESGTTNGEYTANVTFKGYYTPSGDLVCEASISVTVTVVDVELTMYGVDDEDEESPGGFVCLNKDDDNGKGQPDNSEEPVAGEDDLVDVSVVVTPALESDEIITITGHSNMYEDQEKNTPAKSSYEYANLPSVFYLEGDTVSSTQADREIVFEHAKSGAKDVVKYTVVDVEFDNVWDRNLTHSEDQYPNYEKCIAFEHDEAESEIDLAQEYLKIKPNGVVWNDIKDIVSLEIQEDIFDTWLDTGPDGVIEDGSSVLDYDDGDPGIHNIYAFTIDLLCSDDESVLDRLILVIYSEETLTEWNNWRGNSEYGNSGSATNWLAELPPVYSSLDEADDNYNPEPDECDPQRWEDSVDTTPPDYYHFNASFDLRSEEIDGGHGHQACYDADRVLIIPDGNLSDLASSGTADYDAPIAGHRDADVWPFIDALQMDGNPIEGEGVGGCGNTSHPLIRIGEKLQTYYDKRPPYTDDTVAEANCCDTNQCSYH